MQLFSLSSADVKLALRLLPALMIATLSIFSVSAQSLTVQQIDKIVIKQNSGGLGGSVGSTFEIQRKNEGWITQRTERISNLVSYRTAKWENTDSTQIIFIKTVSQASVNKLVYAINHPVKSFSPGLFGITAEFLKAHADSIVKATFYQPTAQEMAALKQEITAERVNQAIIRLHQSDYTDIADIVKIAIVKKNGDTLKIESPSLGSYKLPWKVAGEGDNYNMAITRFCADAINDRSHSFLNGGTIFEDICMDIYNKYCKDRITSTYFRKTFANAFKQLDAQYVVSDITTSDILQAADPIVFMTLHSASMPANVNVNTALRIRHDGDVARLAGLKGKFDLLLKQKNFVFDFILHSPGYGLTIEDPNDSLSQYNWHQSNYPYLKDFPQTSVAEFRVQNKADSDESSQWVLLPNRQLVLVWLSGPRVLNFTRQQLKLDQLPSQPIETCVVFDAGGEMLYNFTR